MAIELKPVILGAKCKIYALQAAGGDCLAEDFLAEQRATMTAEVDKLMRLLEYSAQNGPPKNDEKCNTLGDDIFEFKTTKLRLAWFWDAGFLIVCSHGWLKKSQKAPKGELDRAMTARAAYFEAKRRNHIRILPLET